MAPARNKRSSQRPRPTQVAPLPSTRAPRRCHKCPGMPLKSTCSCSKRHFIAPGAESNGAVSVSALTVLPVGTASIPVTLPASAGPLPPSLENPQIWRHTATEPNAAATNHLDVIDPALLEQPETSRASPAAEVGELENESADWVDESREQDAVQQGKVTRLTTREKAAKFGIVDGVMRGNTVHRIVRQNEKRRPLTDASAATTRYNRELPLIISRAERLALETDAYVLVLAQQATGSSAAIHFASDRMRRDAFDQCGHLVNQFQSLMTQLVIAKRTTAFALAQNLEAAEKARVEAEERLMERENVVANTEAALAASESANQTLLAELEALKNSKS